LVKNSISTYYVRLSLSPEVFVNISNDTKKCPGSNPIWNECHDFIIESSVIPSKTLNVLLYNDLDNILGKVS
jgi:hypothetical protein